jgi:hypothetical protein
VLSEIANLAIEEIRRKSKLRLYQTDYVAWRHDVLGYYSYAKMDAIMTEALHGEKNRTLIKSSNGTSKSWEVSCGILWAGSVFEPGETISIMSAPSVSQLEKVTMAYLKSHYGTAALRGYQPPGKINESLEWKYDGPNGGIYLAFGRKPPAGGDAVSVFQGVRSQHGKTYVWFDEAGGMEKHMWTAMEAVITGADARFIGIGNPDNASGAFYDAFTNEKIAKEYNLFSISSYDLPTFTGERVYPRTPEGDEMEARMLKSLTQVEWVEHKKRIWGEDDARFKAKVLGEFPDTGDNVFFGQNLINLAHETVIDPEGIRPVLGADIARYGQDESVIYQNRGGHVRLVDSWGKTDTVETARKIHQTATRLGAAEVRVDASGIGGAVFDMLERLPEFQPKTYLLIGIDGGSASQDSSRWANARAQNHDSLREQMAEGKIDLDFEDEELKEQLLGVTYKFNNRGAIQITPKDEMRTVMDGSPDRLDAVIYATVDLGWLTGNPLQKGDRVSFDVPQEVTEADPLYELMYGPGMPW